MSAMEENGAKAEVAPKGVPEPPDADVGARQCDYVKLQGKYRGKKSIKNAYHLLNGKNYCMNHCRMLRQMEAEPRRKRNPRKEEYFGTLEENKNARIYNEPVPYLKPVDKPVETPPPIEPKSQSEPIQLKANVPVVEESKKRKPDKLEMKLLSLKKKIKKVKKEDTDSDDEGGGGFGFLDFGRRMGYSGP